MIMIKYYFLGDMSNQPTSNRAHRAHPSQPVTQPPTLLGLLKEKKLGVIPLPLDQSISEAEAEKARLDEKEFAEGVPLCAGSPAPDQGHASCRASIAAALSAELQGDPSDGRGGHQEELGLAAHDAQAASYLSRWYWATFLVLLSYTLQWRA